MLLTWHPGQSTKSTVQLKFLVLACIVCTNSPAVPGRVATVGCYWKQTGPAWVRSGNQAMPVCQSVMCRPSWLRCARPLRLLNWLSSAKGVKVYIKMCFTSSREDLDVAVAGALLCDWKCFYNWCRIRLFPHIECVCLSRRSLKGFAENPNP